MLVLTCVSVSFSGVASSVDACMAASTVDSCFHDAYEAGSASTHRHSTPQQKQPKRGAETPQATQRQRTWSDVDVRHDMMRVLLCVI